MKKIKVHTCIKQEKVVYGLLEPGQAGKCSCRQKVTLHKATQMVRDGEADWTVKSRTRGERFETCDLCSGTGDKTCAKCHGVLKTLEPYVEDIPADDIIMVSRIALSDRKRSSAFKGKTPRVATIEASHMYRAYVSNEARQAVAAAESENAGHWDNAGEDTAMVQFSRLKNIFPGERRVAQERIEEYGMLILDARTYVGPQRIPCIGVEPASNASTHEGRDYDYGRAI